MLQPMRRSARMCLSLVKEASTAGSPLTEREMQILRLITGDRSNAEIGASLRISPKGPFPSARQVGGTYQNLPQ